MNENYDEKVQLITDIRDFLEEYAKIAANYNPDEDDYNERFNGPDSDSLNAAALQLEMEGYIFHPIYSDYGQGCYKISKEGKEIHDSLIERAKVFYSVENKNKM